MLKRDGKGILRQKNEILLHLPKKLTTREKLRTTCDKLEKRPMLLRTPETRRKIIETWSERKGIHPGRFVFGILGFLLSSTRI